MVIASSDCQSYVGARGIVVQETRNVFRIITNENKIKSNSFVLFAFNLNSETDNNESHIP